MAKLDSIIRFTGKLGNIIAYSRGGQHFLRSRPEGVRQTEGTRQAAKWFGASSRKGALIRSAIVPDLDIHCDGTLVNRLNSTIVQAGRNNHAGLTGFSFNPYTSMAQFFPQPPVFTKNGKLHIPKQALKAHGGAQWLEVKLITTRIDFTTRRITGSDAVVQCIDLEQPFEGADMWVEVPGKGTIVVTLQARLYLEDGVSYNRKCFAADIIAVAADSTSVTTIKQQTPRKKQSRPARPLQPAAAASQQVTIQRE